MSLLDLLLPATCPVCRQPGPAPCPPCAVALPRAPALPSPPGVDACHSLLAYDGDARAVVTGLKYRGSRSALDWVADGLAALVAAPPPAAVCWVPVLPAHRVERGVDAGEMVARALARRLRRPAVALLRRRPGAPQAGRSAADRNAGPRLVVGPMVPASVLVVDDVITTGASLAAAARVLRRAGALRVVGAAVARTPPPVDRAR
jgi:predicted amidophosphoribosyltransferase